METHNWSLKEVKLTMGSNNGDHHASLYPTPHHNTEFSYVFAIHAHITFVIISMGRLSLRYL